jgi:N-acyl-L-homoserine lactone synthetase
MIKLFQGYHRSDNSDLFAQMFRHRKAVFCDQKKWDVKIVDGEFEIDEFDREDTAYLMSLDQDGRLVGSVRLLTTLNEHMLSGPFKPMFPDIGFVSPTTWEASRFVVLGDSKTQPNNVSTAACEVLLGMCRFGLDHGVSFITAVYDIAMSRLYRRCGLWNVELGRYRTPQHGAIFVGLWEISNALEASILRATGLEPGNSDCHAEENAA